MIGDFLHLGIWPIIMGVTMWIQMQLNPKQPDPMQQALFNWMPVMFTFMLGAFPAGLVIYWAWSNLLSVSQQYYIMQKNGSDIHLWDNIGISQMVQSRQEGLKQVYHPVRIVARSGAVQSRDFGPDVQGPGSASQRYTQRGIRRCHRV